MVSHHGNGAIHKNYRPEWPSARQAGLALTKADFLEAIQTAGLSAEQTLKCIAAKACNPPLVPNRRVRFGLEAVS